MKARSIFFGLLLAGLAIAPSMADNKWCNADGGNCTYTPNIPSVGPEPDVIAVLNPRAPVTVTIVDCQYVDIDDGKGTHFHAKLSCPKDR